MVEYQEEYRNHRIIMAHFLGASVLQRFYREVLCVFASKLVRILLSVMVKLVVEEGLE